MTVLFETYDHSTILTFNVEDTMVCGVVIYL